MWNKLIKIILILGSAVLVIVIIDEIKTYQKNKPICKDCNILLISLDTLSAKHLPCYGYDKDTAPNLCQFGKDNILFSNSYSQSSWTKPSQASVLTGLHPTTHGVMIPFVDKLLPKFKTIAEILKEYGYETYYFGPATDTSWDESMIRGFDYNRQADYESDSLIHWRKALDILEQNQKSKIPTFMFLHTYYVHVPYITGTDNLKFVNKENMEKHPEVPLTNEDSYKFTLPFKKYILNSLEDRVKNSKTERSLRINTMMLDEIKKTKTLAEAKTAFNSLPRYETDSYLNFWYLDTIVGVNDYNYTASLYDERIYQLDTELKQIFNRIENKFAKDTIVIIYSDHGETLGERGSYAHCYKNMDCLYNETIYVPLIIRVPGLKSKKIDELSQGIDIYPTIMRLIGKTGPDNLEGEDLVDLMTGRQKKSKKDYVVSERDYQKTVVDKKWKLYFKDYRSVTSNNIELYDLKNDLNEQNNVSKNNPKIVDLKIKQLKKFLSGIKDVAVFQKFAFPDWIDEVKKEKLIKEGYF